MIPDEELLAYTSIVSIELSNVCNMKHIHKRCPLNFCKHVGGAEKVILDTATILIILYNLASLDYAGVVGLSIYNEPMLDPRLFYFIKVIKKISHGKMSPFVITNGTYLDQQMIYEMCDLGLGSLWVSCYSDKIYEEFQGYNYPDDLKATIIRYKELEVIDDTYTKPYVDLKKKCNAPLDHMVIRCNGDVHLCCRDFESRNVFGNLHETNLLNIIRKGEMHRLYAELFAGDRKLDICRRCSTAF